MSNPKLRIVLDWGTTHWKPGVYIGRPGSEPKPSEVFLVTDSKTSRAEFPMVAGYFDGEFRGGSDPIEDLMNYRLSEDPVVNLHKLALYESHQTAALTQDVYDTLGGPHKLVPFMSDFMREVLKYIVNWARS